MAALSMSAISVKRAGTTEGGLSSPNSPKPQVQFMRWERWHPAAGWADLSKTWETASWDASPSPQPPSIFGTDLKIMRSFPQQGPPGLSLLQKPAEAAQLARALLPQEDRRGWAKSHRRQRSFPTVAMEGSSRDSNKNRRVRERSAVQIHPQPIMCLVL